MMKKILFGLLAVSMILLNGCEVDREESTFYFVPLPITNVELPDTFFWNEVHTISVTYSIPNSCIQYEGFDINTDGFSTRYVTCIGAEFDGEVCAQATDYGQATFEFLALSTEPYLFRFWTGEDSDGNPEYLEVYVPVRN